MDNCENITKHFVCNTCKKTFKTKSQMTVHKRIHSGETPYKCDDCNKGFTYKHVLKQHIFVHSGKNYFQCYVCGKY